MRIRRYLLFALTLVYVCALSSSAVADDVKKKSADLDGTDDAEIQKIMTTEAKVDVKIDQRNDQRNGAQAMINTYKIDLAAQVVPQNDNVIHKKTSATTYIHKTEANFCLKLPYVSRLATKFSKHMKNSGVQATTNKWLHNMAFLR